MPSFVSPFAKKRAWGVYKLESNGVVFLLQKQSLSPFEDPKDIQKERRREAKIRALNLEALRNYSTEKQIPVEEVRASLSERKKLHPNGEPFLDDDGKPVIIPAISITPGDYLDIAQREELEFLENPDTDIPLKSATLAMQYRILHNVEITSVAEVSEDDEEKGLRGISIESAPHTTISAGSVLRNQDGKKIEIVKLNSSGRKAKIKATNLEINPGDQFFLLDESGEEVTGITGWEQEHTSTLLDTEEVSDLYSFMLAEEMAQVVAKYVKNNPTNGGGKPGGKPGEG